jgi:hypothetical protein
MSSSDVRAFVVTMMLSVLAQPLCHYNALGNAVHIWDADPWLAYCATLDLPSLLPATTAAAPAVQASSKKRPRPAPLVQCVRDRCKNLLHHSNRLRSDLSAMEIPPCALASLVHQGDDEIIHASVTLTE